jgi:hypothetical protein
MAFDSLSFSFVVATNRLPKKMVFVLREPHAWSGSAEKIANDVNRSP